MKIDNVLYIEDSIEKYMDIYHFLRDQRVSQIEWATDAEKALQILEKYEKEGRTIDLILSDMHFDYFGVDDRNAGERIMLLLREKGCKIPFVFCSSQNWKVEGSLGNIFYNPRRAWEIEAEQLFRDIKQL